MRRNKEQRLYFITGTRFVINDLYTYYYVCKKPIKPGRYVIDNNNVWVKKSELLTHDNQKELSRIVSTKGVSVIKRTLIFDTYTTKRFTKGVKDVIEMAGLDRPYSWNRMGSRRYPNVR